MSNLISSGEIRNDYPHFAPLAEAKLRASLRIKESSKLNYRQRIKKLFKIK